MVLCLSNPKPEQSGMYTMTIENPAGKDSVTFEVSLPIWIRNTYSVQRSRVNVESHF